MKTPDDDSDDPVCGRFEQDPWFPTMCGNCGHPLSAHIRKWVEPEYEPIIPKGTR